MGGTWGKGHYQLCQEWILCCCHFPHQTLLWRKSTQVGKAFQCLCVRWLSLVERGRKMQFCAKANTKLPHQPEHSPLLRFSSHLNTNTLVGARNYRCWHKSNRLVPKGSCIKPVFVLRLALCQQEERALCVHANTGGGRCIQIQCQYHRVKILHYIKSTTFKSLFK